MKETDNRKGFTVVEGIITMMLLAAIVAGSLSLYPAVLRFFVRQEQRIIAGNLAYAQIEDLRQIAHNSPLGLGDPSLTDTTHDKTDHIILPNNFALQYLVTHGDWTGGSGTTYKKVTVTCTTPAPYSFPATLEGIVTQ